MAVSSTCAASDGDVGAGPAATANLEFRAPPQAASHPRASGKVLL